jgi:hypothetical protein
MSLDLAIFRLPTRFERRRVRVRIPEEGATYTCLVKTWTEKDFLPFGPVDEVAEFITDELGGEEPPSVEEFAEQVLRPREPVKGPHTPARTFMLGEEGWATSDAGHMEIVAFGRPDAEWLGVKVYGMPADQAQEVLVKIGGKWQDLVIMHMDLSDCGDRACWHDLTTVAQFL